jgi:hypothetical protein
VPQGGEFFVCKIPANFEADRPAPEYLSSFVLFTHGLEEGLTTFTGTKRKSLSSARRLGPLGPQPPGSSKLSSFGSRIAADKLIDVFSARRRPARVCPEPLGSFPFAKIKKYFCPTLTRGALQCGFCPTGLWS